MTLPIEVPSRNTLEDTPERALQFLRGAGTTPIIRSILAQHGYSDEEHDLGWKLLHTVSGFAVIREALGIALDSDVHNAINELDGWDEPNFERIEAMLRRAFPIQAAFLFKDLEPATGAGAVLSVATLLDRLDALESGPERKATRKPDHAALQLLDQRGYTVAERKRLRDLVHVAQKGTASVVPVVDPSAEKARADRQAAMMNLYLWYKDWTATARAVIKRRDYLIRLGLGKRRKPDKNGGTPAPTAAVPSTQHA